MKKLPKGIKKPRPANTPDFSKPSNPYKGNAAELLDAGPADLLLHHLASIGWIGNIALEWSRIENGLAYLYSALVFGFRENSDLGEWIAIDTFEEAKSFNTKRLLLTNAIERRIGRVTRDSFSTLLDRLDKARQRRDKIIHGRWALSPDKKQLVLKYDRGQTKTREIYERDDIIGIFKQLRWAEKELFEFCERDIFPALKPLTGLAAALAAMFPVQDGKDVT